jgi:cyclophilin family peptidyl-prolyl cis-trans isomerase
MLALALALSVPLALSPFQAREPGADAPAAPAGPFVALDVVEGGQRLGTITIELLPDKAPLSVANFLQYVREGHYDGTIFHRVIPNFMIQGGGLTPDMKEQPQRPPIRNEARNRLRNSRGTVAMARQDDPGSATDQFFINVRDNHNLDFGIAGAGYAVFGKVAAGMDVVDRIALVPTGRRGQYENVPDRPVIIERAYEVEAPPPAPPEPAAGEAAPPPAP